jgi:hypothetical protein
MFAATGPGGVVRFFACLVYDPPPYFLAAAFIPIFNGEHLFGGMPLHGFVTALIVKLSPNNGIFYILHISPTFSYIAAATA